MTVGTPERRLTARQRQAQKAAKANGYVDRNLDGMPDPDTLSKEELASEYAIAYNVITQDSELLGLFEQAFNDRGGQWTNQRFKAAIQNSQWYKQNNRFYRQAWLARARKDADWETLRENAKLAIVEKATEIGEQVDGARLEALADDYIFGGWGEPGRQSLLNRALAGDIAGAARPMTTERGAIGNVTQNLRTAAFNNGLAYDDDWYRSAARSVQSGLSTEEDWLRDINEKAAGMFPVFSKQIQAGQTAYNLASPYIRLMSEILEIPVSQITLNDPYIRGALGGFTPDGQPQAMNLGDFARKLRSDPRWKETDQAQNEITGTAGRILQMFGMMGG